MKGLIAALAGAVLFAAPMAYAAPNAPAHPDGGGHPAPAHPMAPVQHGGGFHSQGYRSQAYRGQAYQGQGYRQGASNFQRGGFVGSHSYPRYANSGGYYAERRDRGDYRDYGDNRAYRDDRGYRDEHDYGRGYGYDRGAGGYAYGTGLALGLAYGDGGGYYYPDQSGYVTEDYDTGSYDQPAYADGYASEDAEAYPPQYGGEVYDYPPVVSESYRYADDAPAYYEPPHVCGCR